jgi:hypothetical protein
MFRNTRNAQPTAPRRARLSWRRLFFFLLNLALMTGLMAAAPPGPVEPFVPAFAPYCELYTTVVEWIRTGAAILTVLAILYLGGQKLAASVMPDLGLRTGPVVLGIAAGLILVAFGETMASSLLAAFGLPTVAC